MKEDHAPRLSVDLLPDLLAGRSVHEPPLSGQRLALTTDSPTETVR